MSFAVYHTVLTQKLPQCCKYISSDINKYLLYQKIGNHCRHVYTFDEIQYIDHESFIQFEQKFALFDMDQLSSASPQDVENYIDLTRRQLSCHDRQLYNLIALSLWYKGDFARLKRVLLKTNVTSLVTLACNIKWERGYEDNYTLGQQLSIRITTKLIQSGLDFKHHQDESNNVLFSRGWNDVYFEKYISSFASISDVIKRHKNSNKYIVLELDAANRDKTIECIASEFVVLENANINNLCAIKIDEDKNSSQYLIKLSDLIAKRYVNVLFVTDIDYYYKINHYLFYLYNSLKFYYYCLKNKFVFELDDYEIIFLLNLIISMEWCNGGHLNSFTLEKSEIYNPLELSTRRLNSLKRAALQDRKVLNDAEINIDFIKGKRMKTGTHYGHRIVTL